MDVHPDIQLMLIQQQMRRDQAQVASERAVRALKVECACREGSGRVSFFRNLANRFNSLFGAGEPAGVLQFTPC